MHLLHHLIMALHGLTWEIIILRVYVLTALKTVLAAEENALSSFSPSCAPQGTSSQNSVLLHTVCH
jgi:hypothetical protein